LLLYFIHKPTKQHTQHSITKLFTGILCWHGNIAQFEQKPCATDTVCCMLWRAQLHVSLHPSQTDMHSTKKY